MKGAAPPFFARYGMTRTDDPEAPLLVDPYPEIGHRGVLRRAVIAAAIDIVGSLHARELAGSDATFTTDLSVRAPNLASPKSLVARGTPLRTGRSLITSGVVLEADGAPVAYGQTTFMRVARRGDDAVDERDLAMPEVIHQIPLERPLVEEVGIEVVDPARGRVEVELRDALRNPEGVMQGALVALLAEVSAETLADCAHVEPQVVTEIDVRYLATSRVGPITAESKWIGDPESGMLRTQLRDRGNDDRLTAAVLLRTASV